MIAQMVQIPLMLHLMMTLTLSRLWKNADQSDQGAEVAAVAASHPLLAVTHPQTRKKINSPHHHRQRRPHYCRQKNRSGLKLK